jgi:hypothetical protein
MSVEPHFRQYFCYIVVLFVLLEKTIDFYTITDNLYQVMMDALHPVEVYFTTRIYKWKAPITPYDNGHKLLRTHLQNAHVFSHNYISATKSLEVFKSYDEPDYLN